MPETTDNKINLVFERTCINCNYFFPYLLYGPSEYGICLKDDEFEPYIEELLENENYDCCIELIEKKKFDGNEHTCKDFEMVGIIGADLSEDELSETGMDDMEIMDDVINIALKYRSVKDYREMISGTDAETRLKAFESLNALVSMGNNEASDLLIASFKEIPPPVSLEDVHFKLNVFRFADRDNYVKDLIPVLIRDLYETKSTNQTRQWFSEIFRFLGAHRNEENVTNSLEKMLVKKQFSYRIKQKIRSILQEEDYY